MLYTKVKVTLREYSFVFRPTKEGKKEALKLKLSLSMSLDLE